MNADQFFKFHFGFFSDDNTKFKLSPSQVCEVMQAYAEHCEETKWISIEEGLPGIQSGKDVSELVDVYGDAN